MMKGLDIGIQEKEARFFNEWEMFTSTEGESIESYYHRFLKLMHDLKQNKHFPKKIASNLKFLNNLQPELSRHVTIVYQTKDLHTADYTQLNQVAQNAIQNLRVRNVRNQNWLIGVPKNANQNGNGNLVVARAEGNATRHNAAVDLDEIEEVNANCILMANPKQTSTSILRLTKLPSMIQTDQLRGTVDQHPTNVEETRALYDSLYQNFVIDVEKVNTEAAKFVGDFKSLAKEDDESIANHKAMELEIEYLLRAVVSQDIISVVQNNSVVDILNL
nr:hypothetical protein [Tanacetum cinerariifolium]